MPHSPPRSLLDDAAHDRENHQCRTSKRAEPETSPWTLIKEQHIDRVPSERKENQRCVAPATEWSDQTCQEPSNQAGDHAQLPQSAEPTEASPRANVRRA